MPDNKPTILIVDDELINRVILHELFKTNYNVLEAENGAEGLEIIRNKDNHISLVLLDIVMPILDGFGVLKVMSEENLIGHIPVIMITAEKGDETAVRGYEYGVSDFINKPFNADIVQHRSKIIIELNEHRNHLEELLAKEMAIVENQKVIIEKNNDFLVDALANVVEFRHSESGSHVKRVRGLTKVILQEVAKRNKKYNLTADKIELITKASAMHDLGKVAIPDAVLEKPGRLTNEEFELMKKHTTFGSEILDSLDYDKNDEFFAMCYDIVRHHHERYDGRGYPDHLYGDDISIGAQAVALADVYDALTNNRVYKPAFSHEESVAMIARGECGTFNPLIIECLLAIADNLHDLVEKSLATHVVEKQTKEEEKNEEVLSERAIKTFEKERFKQQIISNLSGEIIFDYNYASDTLTISERAIKIFNIPSSLSNFKEYFLTNEIFEKHDIEKLLSILKTLTQQTPEGHIEALLNTCEGHLWYDIKFCMIANSTGSSDIVGRLLDITKQKQQYENLRELASSDELTSLLNKRVFIDQLNNRYLKEENNGYLLLLDLDNFKIINDTYGHVVGDNVLQQVSQDIKKKLRGNDTIARLGGDEFTVFISNIQRENLEKILKRLCFTSIQIQGKNVVVTNSIGISEFPKEGTQYIDLYNKADIAMYHAKNRSKSNYVFSQDVEN
ncbi:MAG: diguanylate cyclase [Bacillales bacterium]|jgi:putative two-component system response regulator|nr:diguanylate cyclase [Bacillales bacterium]